MIAEARYGFRWHLAIYIIVNLGLVAIWYYTGAGFPWPIFPILFWGLGLLGHYWGAYHTTGGGWIERENPEDPSGRRQESLVSFPAKASIPQ